MMPFVKQESLANAR